LVADDTTEIHLPLSFGPTAVGPSWGPSHGGSHFHGECKYNDVQNDKNWRNRIKDEGKRESNQPGEDIVENTPTDRSWQTKKMLFLRDPVVRTALARAKMRADAIDRGDRGGNPWISPAAAGAARAEHLLGTPDATTFVGQSFPKARQTFPKTRGVSARSRSLTPMPLARPPRRQQERLPHPRSQSAMDGMTAPLPRVAQAQSRNIETPWMVRNSRPKRQWGNPVPGHPGAQYINARTGWIAMSNTGRGYLVPKQHLRDTGVLKAVGGASSINAFAGCKD